MNKSRWTPIDELRYHVGTLGEYLLPAVKAGTIILMRLNMIIEYDYYLLRVYKGKPVMGDLEIVAKVEIENDFTIKSDNELVEEAP